MSFEARTPPAWTVPAPASRAGHSRSGCQLHGAGLLRCAALSLLAALCAAPPAAAQHEEPPRFSPRPAEPQQREPELELGPGVGDGPSTGQPASPLTPQRLMDVGESRAIPLDGSWWPLWWEHNKFGVLDPRRVTAGAHARWGGAGEGSDGLAGRGLQPRLVRERVAPAFESALGELQDPVARGHLLLASARVAAVSGAPELVSTTRERLLQALREPPVAETAALALGLLADDASALRLTDLVVDEERGRELCASALGVPARLRAMAAYALARSARDAARPELARYGVHHLARTLRQEAGSPDVEAACVAAIGRLPLAPFAGREETLAGRTASPSESLSAQVEHLLGLLDGKRELQTMRGIHAPTALARLVASLDSRRSHRELRRRVIEALLPLVEGRGERAARRSAVLALGALGTAGAGELEERVRSALFDLRGGKQLGTRAWALVALAQLGARPGWSVDEPFAGSARVEAELLRTLRRGPQELQPWAGLALGVLGGGLRAKGQRLQQASADLLLNRVREVREPEAGSAYALACALIGDGRAFDAILRDLHEFEDAASRGDVALALGLLGNRRALDALRELSAASAHAPRVLEQCSLARALLADEDLVPDLVVALEASDCWTSAAAVCRSLAWTGDERAFEPLLALLASGSRSARERAVAAEALGWLVQPDPRPLDLEFTLGANYGAAPPSLSADDERGLLERF